VVYTLLRLLAWSSASWTIHYLLTTNLNTVFLPQGTRTTPKKPLGLRVKLRLRSHDFEFFRSNRHEPSRNKRSDWTVTDQCKSCMTFEQSRPTQDRQVGNRATAVGGSHLCSTNRANGGRDGELLILARRRSGRSQDG